LKLLEKLTTAEFVQSVKTESKKTYTLQEWFDEWLTSYKGNLRAVTVKGYQTLFATHCADLLSLKLTEITNAMLAKIVNTMNGCKQAKDSMKSLLKQMFTIAHNEKFIENNPTLNLPRPKATPPIRARKALTPSKRNDL
jgi:site-specific recombinase XerD